VLSISDPSLVTTAPEVSVIVPVYNEQGNVGPLQAELEDALKTFRYEILFVDDGSSDNTARNIRRSENVKILQFSQNQGQSAALLAGLRAATGDILVLIDGDLQNDPKDIPLLLEHIAAGFDLVCGYRKNRQDTWFKRIQSRIANLVRSRVTKDGVRDTGCTLKAMRKECREALVPFSGMHRFIPALVKGLGYRLVEVPVNHRLRSYGASKYRFGNRALRATIDMLGVRWLLHRQVRIQFRELPSEPE
jgi:dolichol-phosphate mannosyltransferase